MGTPKMQAEVDRGSTWLARNRASGFVWVQLMRENSAKFFSSATHDHRRSKLFIISVSDLQTRRRNVFQYQQQQVANSKFEYSSLEK
jgi:hypothetical protein